MWFSAVRKTLEQLCGPLFERPEPAGEPALKLDGDEARGPYFAAPLVLEQAVQQRECLIVAPQRVFLQTIQVPPLKPLFRKGAADEFREQAAVRLERDHRFVANGWSHLGRQVVAKQRQELVGNDRELVQMEKGAL